MLNKKVKLIILMTVCLNLIGCHMQENFAPVTYQALNDLGGTPVTEPATENTTETFSTEPITENIAETFSTEPITENVTEQNDKVYNIDFNDDCSPGEQFHYLIDIENATIEMEIFKGSSVLDMKPTTIHKTVTIENKEALKLIEQILELNVSNNYNWMYVFCSSLEEMELINRDVEIATSKDYNWENMYKDSDLNNDGKVTAFEDFKAIAELMINDLKKTSNNENTFK